MLSAWSWSIPQNFSPTDERPRQIASCWCAGGDRHWTALDEQDDAQDEYAQDEYTQLRLCANTSEEVTEVDTSDGLKM